MALVSALWQSYHLVIQHRHGKSPFLIGKPSINGPFSMAMLNNQRVIIIQRQKLTWQQWKFRSERMVKWKEGCWMSQHDRQSNSRLSVYPLVNVNKKQWKHPPCLMGKSTISTGPFSIAMFVYQRVTGVLKQSLYCNVLKVYCLVWLCGLVSDFVWNSWYSRSVAANLGYGSQTGRA